MATKVKRKSKKKSTRATKKDKPINQQMTKNREDAQFHRKIIKYENNFVDGLRSISGEGYKFLEVLLYVALFPQLTNHLNIHDYKKFYL